LIGLSSSYFGDEYIVTVNPSSTNLSRLFYH
jgi:hypothetical protein